MLTHRPATVQVAEGDVGEPVERLQRHPVQGADGGGGADVALAVGQVGPLEAPGPGVRHDDVAPVTGCGRSPPQEVARPADGSGLAAHRGHPGRVRRVSRIQGGDARRARPGQAGPGHGRLQERQGPDGDGAVDVGQQDGVQEPVRRGPYVHPGAGEQPTVGAEPDGGVVVAAGDHEGGTGVGDPGDRVVPQLDGLRGRDGPVEDVPAEQDRVHLLLADHLHQVVDPRPVRRSQVRPVQGAAQVPVGGVEQAHATTLGRGPDTTPQARPVAGVAGLERPWTVSPRPQAVGGTVPGGGPARPPRPSGGWGPEVPPAS